MTKLTVVYAIRMSISHEVPLNILAENVACKNITERCRAYNTLAAKTGDLQLCCRSHILGIAKARSWSSTAKRGKHIHDTPRSIHKDAKALNHMGNE